MAPNVPSLTAVLHGVIVKNAAPSGLDAQTIADLVGKPYQTLMSELERQQGHKLGADFVIPLCRASGSDVPMQFLARELGGLFVRLPDAGGDSGELVSVLAKSIQEFSAFATEVAADISDNDISADELARIEKEGDEAIEAIMRMKKLARVTHAAQHGGK